MKSQVHNSQVRRIWLLIAFILSCYKISAYDFQVDGLYYNIISGTNEVYVKPANGKVAMKYTGEITIPETVNDYNGNVYTVVGIGESAFAASSITSITLPNTLRFIEQYAFSQCSQLKALQLPNRLESIGRAFISKSAITHIKIPNSVISIAAYAFGPDANSSPCQLESIDLTELSSSVTELPEGMFWTCSLKSIAIPNSIKTIGKEAFKSCDKLKTVILPNSITTIEAQAFYGCTSLESINLPDQINSIGNSAFWACSSLKSIKIPSSLSIIEDYVFLGCQSLVSVEFPETITTIGRDAFSGCINLKEIVLPNTLKTIGVEAFENCQSLTKIVLPANVTEIGKDAFIRCSLLNEVESKIKEPFETYAFTSYINYQHYPILYVPSGTKEKYSNCYGWGNVFKEIIENVETYTLSITASGNGSASYNSTTIRSKTSSFTVNAGTSATITFTPDNGYRIKSVKVNNSTVSVSNNQYTISSINANTTVSVEFEAIPVTTYTLSITASGSGSASYGGTTIRSKTSTFTVNAGSSATITFSPDNGYRIKSVKVNNSTVSVSNNQYTISSINANTNVNVEFEAITYTLSITASGNGSASYSGTTVRSKTFSFTVNAGSSATITFTPDNGYRIKSVKVNNTTVSVSNNQYTISNINANTTVSVEFEAIPVTTTYTLSITASGNGSASYSGTTIRSKTSTFTVNAGSSATITFTPNNGYRIKSVKVNNTTVSVSNNQYTISNINADTTVSVEFEAITYTLSITASGNGSASYSGTTVRGKTSSFTLNAGSSATITFSPDNGYRIKSVKVNNSTVSVSNNQYTISSINANTTISVEFEAITYTLSITASGSGSASYGSTTIRGKTSTFTVDAGTSATITFTPDNGYRIKSVKVNNTTISVSNNQYTINNISANTTVSVEFEAIPVTTYTLSITASGNGSASYSGTTIRSKTSTFTVNAGSSATITFTPDNGYRIKSVKVNNTTVSVSNNQYTISSINANTSVSVEFDAIPVTIYTLSITASGNGSASYSGSSIRSKTSSFAVNAGTSATITFTPDNGYRIKSVKLNSSDVTSYVSNKSYTISNITKNTSLEVEFAEELKTFTSNGINYSVSSYDDKTVIVGNGNYGKVLEVPAEITYQDIKWKVIGIDNAALADNTELAAIIWNPAAMFTISVSNPNLLLYVTSANYAPSSITNVIVNNTANKIVLSDAASGNDFYCPKEFTAKSISYTHNYLMTTGIGESRGWETIALPFDVQKISHSSKGEITPFVNWKSGDSKRPFWLMTYGVGGWTEASSIEANTPYIISMPNHSDYKSEFRINGNITFSAVNATVKKSDNILTSSYERKTFVPNYANQDNNSYFVLNVNNDYVTYYGGSSEGSSFVAGLRAVHPFEAYMTSSSNAARFIAISDDLVTGIEDYAILIDESKGIRVYNLKGQLVIAETSQSLDEIKKRLPAGVYIVNGKKLIIK